MRHFLAALTALVFVSLGGISGAAECQFKAGDYVTSNLDNEPVVYLILGVTDSISCLVEYRKLVPPGEPFDPYISGMMEDFLFPYDGPIANTNRYACAYDPGQDVDYQTHEGEWRSARITDSDKNCAYSLDYYEGGLANAGKVADYEAADRLRPATLATPSEDEKAAATQCTPGGRAEDFADDNVESAFRRLIIEEVSAREEEPVSVYFDRIRYGQTAIVVDGGTFSAKNPDAALGTEFVPVRLDVRVCKDSSGRPEAVSHVYDYNCFTDKFGDFICRLEAER